METLSLVDRLQAASAVLKEIQGLAAALPEHREDAVTMALHMALVDNYLAELAVNLIRGSDVYDAVLTTARGATPL